MKRRRNTNIEISIKDILWKLLEQWRAVVIFAIVVGVVCMLFMHTRDVNEWQINGQNAAQKQEQIAEAKAKEDNPYIENQNMIRSQLESLPESQRGAVENLLAMKSAIKSLQDYSMNSALMNIDPSNRHMVRLSYVIRLDDNNQQYRQSLVSAYRDLLKKELVAPVSEILSSEMDEKYIRELISVSEYFMQTEEGEVSFTPDVLAIEITLPENVDSEVLQGNVQKIVSEQNALLTERICAHEMIVYDVEDVVESDDELLYHQVDSAEQLSILNTGIINAEGALSAEQMAVYQQIQSLLEEDATQDVAGTISPMPSYSKKWLAVGFVLGIIIYAILYVIYLILFRRIRSSEEIAMGWDARVFGEFYQYNRKGIGKLINSRNVFRLRHKDKLDIDYQIDNIYEAACGLGQHFNLNQIVFVPVADQKILSDNGWISLRTSLEERIKADLPSISFRNVFSCANRVDEIQIQNVEGIVPVIVSEKTRPEMLDELIAAAESYGVKVLGAVFVQG